MNKLITKKSLREIGFSKKAKNIFTYDVFEVDMTNENDPSVLVSGVPFPDATSDKDLKDLMFMYYGEATYTEYFGHLKAEIVDVSYSEAQVKQMLMDAFDDGFLSSDEKLSPYPNYTSKEWYAKKYGE